MNTLLKACIATGMLAAAATPAMATIDSGDSSNGELFLTMIDPTAGRSVVLGLNLHLNDVLPSVLEGQNGTTVLSFDVSSQVSAILGSGATLANLSYNVVAVDSQQTAGNNAFGRQIAATGALGAEPNPVFSNTNLRIATTNAGTIAGNVNGGNGDGAVATSAETFYANIPAWALDAGNTIAGLSGAFGNALGFYYYASSTAFGAGESNLNFGGRAVANKEVFQQASTNAYGEWLLSGSNGTYTLTYGYDAVDAPVPLPAAAWLLLSGLAGMGVIGRRRREQAAA